MEHATLHLHDPIEFVLADGRHFDANRIAVLEDEHPESHALRVYGVLHDPDLGTCSRILVIHFDTTVDLRKNLRAITEEWLAGGKYEIV